MAFRLMTAFLLAISATDAEENVPPDFVVHTANGSLPAAPLLKLGEDWSINLGGASPRFVAGADLISVRPAWISLPPFPQHQFALLSNGDRIPLDPAFPWRVTDERLVVRPAFRLLSGKSQELSIPLTFVSLLCLTVPDGVEDPALFLSKLEKSKRPQDLLFLKSGDRLEGAFASLDLAKGFTFKVSGRVVETGIGQVALFANNSEWQARPRVKKALGQVILRNGARLQLASARVDPERKLLVGKALFGPLLEVPLNLLASLDIQQGGAVFLSDLTPKQYEHTPFLGLSWPLVKDASVTGKQMRLGDSFFDKGLGMHGQSRVTYNLDSGYRWFEALVGLDAETGKRGRARISVLVDGKKHEALAGKELSAPDAPAPVRLDVRKARELTLVVEFGSFGDVEAHVDWVEARLIREK